MSTAPLVSLARVAHTPTQQLSFGVPSIGGAVESCPSRYGRWGGIGDHAATRRWKRQRQRHSIRRWPSVALWSSSTTPPPERDGPHKTGQNTDHLEEGDAFVSLDSGGRNNASEKDGASATGGRVAGGDSTPENTRFDEEDLPKTSAKPSRGSGMTDGRIRLKWGIDLDIQVPVAVEVLVKGPWDPDGAIWGKQLDMALEVIRRSGGVVFLEQLLPILNPREGPSEHYYYGLNGRRGDGGTTSDSGTTNSAATSEGDILYVFRGLAGTDKGESGVDVLDASEEDLSGAKAEVLQFEEVSGFLEALPKILNDKGPALAKEFFARTTLSGLALFLATCLLLGQLLFGSWPLWLATGPGYLLWVGFDDTLKRSRNAAAKQRDQFRGQWADACRGDSDAVWRKRAAARSRARRLSGDKMR